MRSWLWDTAVLQGKAAGHSASSAPSRAWDEPMLLQQSLAAWIQPQCTQTINISHHLSCLRLSFHSELVWLAAFCSERTALSFLTGTWPLN